MLNKISPSSRTLIATSLFAIAGILSWIFFVDDAEFSLPLALFYIILLINTYFSVKFFSTITPATAINNSIDDLLAIIYIALAVHFSSPLYFMLFNLLLFVVATAKYSFLLGTIEYLHLLKKKILAELLGCILCTLTLAGMFYGYVFVSIWCMTAVFAIANVLVLFVWPLYKIDSKSI